MFVMCDGFGVALIARSWAPCDVVVLQEACWSLEWKLDLRGRLTTAPVTVRRSVKVIVGLFGGALSNISKLPVYSDLGIHG